MSRSATRETTAASVVFNISLAEDIVAVSNICSDASEYISEMT